jgi:streptomycin 6-kinase
MTLGPVTAGCRQRLVDHYGDEATGWLEQVPSLLAAAARSWGLQLLEYHDAGHASALALAITDDGRQVLLKAWYDRHRYQAETAALEHWEPVNGCLLRAHDVSQAVACLELVGNGPGGGARPVDDQRRVAAALAQLHDRPMPDRSFPDLLGHVGMVVEPRIRQRAGWFGDRLPLECLELGLTALDRLTLAGRRTLLHADLYQENVVFDSASRPVFLDPLPMTGPAIFDWAFFVVYFDLARDPITRLQLATEASGIPVTQLLPWCLMLSLDGLLYYHYVRDNREMWMPLVMTRLTLAGA